jgi:phosphoglycerol transferase MdoB-like AlkP superfamily enzyme
MKTATQSNLTKWVSSNLLVNVVCMGILHSLIAHGWGGPHGKDLTPFQGVTHMVSLWLFLAVLLYAQHRALPPSAKLFTLANLAAFLVVVPVLFWAGYYGFYIPFDILFMYVGIGGMNGWLLRHRAARPGRWVAQMLFTGLCAALAGIAVGFGAYFLFIKDLTGMTMDITLWIFISVPAGLVYGLLGRPFIRRQFTQPAAVAALRPELQPLPR